DLMKGPLLRVEYPDQNQIHKLNITLGIGANPAASTKRAMHRGFPTPPGYHFLYFLPDAGPDKLRDDGTFNDFSPGDEFPRRMWAGGRIEWVKGNPLVGGQECKELTALEDFQVKRRGSGDEMIVMKLRKEFYEESGKVSIRELR